MTKITCKQCKYWRPTNGVTHIGNVYTKPFMLSKKGICVKLKEPVNTFADNCCVLDVNIK